MSSFSFSVSSPLSLSIALSIMSRWSSRQTILDPVWDYMSFMSLYPNLKPPFVNPRLCLIIGSKSPLFSASIPFLTSMLILFALRICFSSAEYPGMIRWLPLGFSLWWVSKLISWDSSSESYSFVSKGISSRMAEVPFPESMGISSSLGGRDPRQELSF